MVVLGASTALFETFENQYYVKSVWPGSFGYLARFILRSALLSKEPITIMVPSGMQTTPSAKATIPAIVPGPSGPIPRPPKVRLMAPREICKRPSF
jgi:hypothetical protein